MASEEKVKQWIAIANKDLALAEHTANTMWPTPYELVCFHCQQAVEKYLKGFLVFHEIEPPRIHDLVELLKICEKINPKYLEISEKCSMLTEYGVQPRYPTEMQIQKEDMSRALGYAKTIKQFMQLQAPDIFRNDDNNKEPPHA